MAAEIGRQVIHEDPQRRAVEILRSYKMYDIVGEGSGRHYLDYLGPLGKKISLASISNGIVSVFYDGNFGQACLINELEQRCYVHGIEFKEFAERHSLEKIEITSRMLRDILSRLVGQN